MNRTASSNNKPHNSQSSSVSAIIRKWAFLACLASQSIAMTSSNVVVESI